MSDPLDDTRPLALDVVTLMLSPRGELWEHADWVTAAALLVDLSRRERLVVSDSGQHLSVAVKDATPVGDDLLDDALQTIASQEGTTRVTKLIKVLPKAEQVLERLVAEGTVTTEEGRKLGLVKVTRHHPTPAADRESLMATVRGALSAETAPGARAALLFSILAICRELRAGVPQERRNEVARQVLAIREGIGDDEAELVATVNEVVVRAHSSSHHFGQ